jgi:5-methylthioadenosine/S-adenosylhomocysteine deaminase
MTDAPLPVDFLFEHGTLITMDDQRNIIPLGTIAVKNAQIVWVGSDKDAQDRFTPAHRIDLSSKVAAPGMINAHGHWAMTLFRGLVDDRPLEAWLETIWKVEGAFTSPENVAAGSRLAMVEMIRGGTTCAADMYWQFRTTTEEARQAGFRMINGPSFTEIKGYKGQRSVEYDGAIEYLDRYQNDPLIHLCVQTHATYTTNLSMMEDARRLSEERDLVFITHASESRAEVQTVREKYGKSPIEVLDEAGLLGERTLLAHCVHLTDEEIQRLAETGTSVAHCPSSNLKLSSGIARIADMVKAGVNVAFGTDGPASNNDLSLFAEARLASMVQKGVTGDPSVLPAEKVFAMLTIDGAQAVGMGSQIGSLEAGKLADIMVLDFDSPNLTPCYDLYSHLIYAVAASDVCHLMVNGKMLMQDRRLLTLNENEVKAQVRHIAREIGVNLGIQTIK